MTDARTVYRKLRDETTSGALPPGSPLREIPLANRFGVSRTPIREALRRLEQDRLLVPGERGMLVRAIDPHEVIQIYELRVLLEAEAAGLASRSRRPADLVRLEGLLARDRALIAPDDATRVRTNLEFHSAIWQATHNAVLVDLLERLTTHFVHAPHSTLSVGDRWREALAEHARLLDAIRDHDEPTARRRRRAHDKLPGRSVSNCCETRLPRRGTVSWTRSRLVPVDNLLDLCCWAPARFVNLA